ncbi:MAG: hypothetical protein HQ567_14900 [Candidatus Nealsonbacteria bacterium]|nr:hypothetical protein [Candidatus Nealsonbacteria bacterium]
MAAGDDGAFEMNDWSFGQLCRLAGVAKETVNRLAAGHGCPGLRRDVAYGQQAVGDNVTRGKRATWKAVRWSASG